MTDRHSITADPISAAAFAPFGSVLEAPSHFGRTYFDSGLANERPSARCSLSVSRIAPTPDFPLTAIEMERHEFSSQSFIPMDVSRYLIVVAPHLPSGAPDTRQARAFIVPGDVGITYGADVWHHPIAVLDRPGRFAIVMWADGSDRDEEFVKLENPFEIILPRDK
jgi:ureidoglycolate lyase